MLDSALSYIKSYKEKDQPALYLYYFYLKNDWQSAVKAAELHKTAFGGAVSNYQAAQSMMNLGKYTEALPWLKAAVKIMPFELEYRLKLGENLLYLESFDEAREQFNFVLKENPKLATAWNDAGFLDLLERKPEDAFIKFQNALNLNPDYIPSQINIAKVYMLRGDKIKAVNQLKMILQKNKNNQDAEKLLKYLEG
jgi:tetratricopeptide (TPR) repeat protein